MNIELFKPNAHSVWQVNRVPATQEEVTNIKNFAESVGIDLSEKDIERVNEGVTSANFVVMEKTNRTCLYRRAEILRDPESLKRTSRLLEYLFSKLVRVPLPLRFSSIEGNPFAVPYEGKWWQRFTFVPGNHYQGNRAELMQAGWHIAVLHEKLRSYPNVSEFPDKLFGYLDVETWKRNLSLIEDTVFSGMVSERFAFFKTMIDEIVNKQWQVGNDFELRQIIHGDIHPQNLLYAPNGDLQAIIDFGECGIGELGLDVANAMQRLVRQYVVKQRGVDTPIGQILDEGVRAFIDGYEAFDQVNKLSWLSLPMYMREILLRKVSVDMEQLVAKMVRDEDTVEELNRWFPMFPEIDLMEESLKRVL